MALLQSAKRILSNCNVEVIVILNGIAMSISVLVNPLGMYQVVCQQLLHSDSDNIASDMPPFVRNSTLQSICKGMDEANADNDTALWYHQLEFSVQETTAYWFMVLAIAHTLPGLISDVVLAAYSDQYGRKTVILLGLFGLVAASVATPFLFEFPLQVPMSVVALAHVVGGLTGFVSSLLSACAAYLADTVEDRQRSLTVRMTILQVCYTLPNILGPVLASSTLKAINYAQVLIVAICLTILAFIWAVIRLKRVPPGKVKKAELPVKSDAQVHPENTGPATPKPEMQPESLKAKIKRQATASWMLIKSVWITYSKPRDGHSRAYLWLTGVIFFVGTAADSVTGNAMFSLYVQKAPLLWREDMISYYKAILGLVKLAGATVGVIAMKKLFHFSDTFIILLSILSSALQLTLIAFARESWMLFVAAGAGVLSALSNPCIQSFVAKLVEPDEVGKSYTAFSLSSNFAYLVSSTVTGAIYRATLSYFPGFMFLFMAILLVISFVAVGWMHWDWKKEKRGKNSC